MTWVLLWGSLSPGVVLTGLLALVGLTLLAGPAHAAVQQAPSCSTAGAWRQGELNVYWFDVDQGDAIGNHGVLTASCGAGPRDAGHYSERTAPSPGSRGWPHAVAAARMSAHGRPRVAGGHHGLSPPLLHQLGAEAQGRAPLAADRRDRPPVRASRRAAGRNSMPENAGGPFTACTMTASLVREIARLGGDVSGFVPPAVASSVSSSPLGVRRNSTTPSTCSGTRVNRVQVA